MKHPFGLIFKMLVPIAIGMAVVWWLFSREFDPAVLDSIHWSSRVLLCIVLALLFMAGRDYGMTWRFRILTDMSLSWLSALKVCMLCEFTSCVTPTTAGGSALGMLFLHREGIEFGKGTALMMTTLFLDNLFFVLTLPLFLLLVPYDLLFGFGERAFTVGLQSVFWSIYGLLTAWTAVLCTGILIKPRAIRTALGRLFRLGWLRRWADKADALGADMEATGRDLRHRSLSWWLKAFAATSVSWLSRFLLVNALFLGFAPGADQFVVLARQFVVWVILMVSPTPGGAGISEWLFTTYYGDLLGGAGMALVIALFWRILSYYVYLIIGCFILPSWLGKGLKKSRKYA
ncbi:MAG: flippase-like domain-containing protein [Duncaniella sp.]|nr:flippase-like domain-containing protein [Duncaniella sp.]